MYIDAKIRKATTTVAKRSIRQKQKHKTKIEPSMLKMISDRNDFEGIEEIAFLWEFKKEKKFFLKSTKGTNTKTEQNGFDIRMNKTTQRRWK